MAKKPFSKFRATTADIFPSVAVHTYVTCKRQLLKCCKCSYVVTATFLDHDKVQKTDLKPMQLVKSEWSPPLQQLPVSSVSTKCLRIDSTKQLRTAWCSIFYFCSKQTSLYLRMNMCSLFLKISLMLNVRRLCVVVNNLISAAKVCDCLISLWCWQVCDRVVELRFGLNILC